MVSLLLSIEYLDCFRIGLGSALGVSRDGLGGGGSRDCSCSASLLSSASLYLR